MAEGLRYLDLDIAMCEPEATEVRWWHLRRLYWAWQAVGYLTQRPTLRQRVARSTRRALRVVRRCPAPPTPRPMRLVRIEDGAEYTSTPRVTDG